MNNNVVADNALLEALKNKKPKEALKYITNDNADLSVRDALGATPLHLAAFEGYADVVLELIKRGMPLACFDSNYQTPLHKAAIRGQTEAMLALLSHGALVYTLDNHGRLPLEMTVMNKQVEAAELLLLAGSATLLQSWTWLSDDLDEKQKALVKLIAQQRIFNPGYSHGGIKSGLKYVQPNSSIDFEKMNVTVVADSTIREPFYLYCRRMQRQYVQSKSLIKADDEEFFGDAYEFRAWKSKRKVITLKMTFDFVPRVNENLRLVPSNLGRVVNCEYERSENENESKTHLEINFKLESSGMTTLCFVSYEKKEIVQVTEQAVTIKPEMEPDAEIDIPKGTFSSPGEMAIQVVETKETNEEASVSTEGGPLLMTNVLDISMTNGQQPKQGIQMKLPLVSKEIDETIKILASSEDDPDPEDLEVLPVEKDPSGKFALFTISHFSFYVAATAIKIEKELGAVVEAVKNTKDKIRKIEFVLMKIAPERYARNTNVIVMCGARRKLNLHKTKWGKRGYEVEGGVSDLCSFQEGQKFKIQFSGNIKERNNENDIVLTYENNSTENYRAFEVSAVDDGDVDGSIEIHEITESYPQVEIVTASSCFGTKTIQTQSTEPEIILSKVVDLPITVQFENEPPIKTLERVKIEEQEKRDEEELQKRIEELRTRRKSVVYPDENLQEYMQNERQHDESTLKALKVDSLWNIVERLSEDESKQLATQLGYRSTSKFEKRFIPLGYLMLKEWRGKRPHWQQIDRLAQALQSCNKPLLADTLTDARDKDTLVVFDDVEYDDAPSKPISSSTKTETVADADNTVDDTVGDCNTVAETENAD